MTLRLPVEDRYQSIVVLEGHVFQLSPLPATEIVARTKVQKMAVGRIQT